MSKADWFKETRPQFLLLSVVLVMHGSALAFLEGHFDWLMFGLALSGLLLLHASVNVLNDWHDHRSGIDLATKPTPFSGGSGMLPAGALKPFTVLMMGVAFLLAGSAIGLYLAWVAGWKTLVIGAIGAFCVVAYTPVLSHLGLGEIFAGLGLGYLPVLGVYFVHAHRLSASAWVSAIPAGLLTYNLLLLNEIPDMEADAGGGRRTMVTLFGRRAAAILYSLVEVSVYVAIVAGVLAGLLTPWALLGLGAAVFAARAIKGALTDYASFEGLIPAQGANVGAVLMTNLLMAIGYLTAGLLA